MRTALLVITLLPFGLMAAGAETTAIVFSFTAEDYPPSRIIESLHEGHRSQVHFEFRIFRRAKGLRRLFGDKLITKEETFYVARWDALDGNYVVLVDESTERVFGDDQSFLSFFLSVDHYRMRLPGGISKDDYLLCRWRIQPIKLVPPLTLMTLIKSDLQTISSWQRTPIERVVN